MKLLVRWGLFGFMAALPGVTAVQAGTLAGVTLPDEAVVGGQTLHLNGLGLREYMLLDIYVGALYLPTPTRSASEAVEADVAKRIVMHIIFRKVTREQAIETFKEHLDRNPDIAALGERVEKLYGYLEEMVAGDEVVLDYVPGVGTSVRVNGRAKGTLPGADLMRAIWTIFLGPKPASENLKKGMLGGGS